MMKEKWLRKLMTGLIIVGILVESFPTLPALAAVTPDPKASNARVYEAGTDKTLSPKRGSRVDVFVTINDKKLTEKDLKDIEKPITVRKKEDSFEAKGSEYGELVDGIKSTGDGIIFQLMFSDLEYTGSSNKLIFDLTYGIEGTEKKTLSVSVPNCIEFNHSDYTGEVPKIEVSNITYPGTIKANQTFILEFDAESTIKNMVFKNVELNYGEVSTGIETTTMVDTKKLPSFKAEGPNTTQIELKTKKTLENNFETITLVYTYYYRKDGEMTEGKDTIKIKIPVIKNKKDEDEPDDMTGTPYIVIDSYDYGSKQVQAGNTVTVQGVFKNTSEKYDVKNVAIVFSTSDGLISKEASNKIFIKNLPKGGKKSEKLTFLVDKDVTTGFQTITYEIHYDYMKDKKKESKDTTESMKISVKGKKKTTDKETIGKRTPAVMVSHYKYGGKVPAGKKFTLDMTLKNTSSELKIENLTMSLEVAEGLSITSSSNTFYFDHLNANGTTNQKVKMQALPSAKSASTNITVNFKYEYIDKKQRNSVTSTETIAIPIYQPDRMKITMPELPEFITVGEEINFSIPYVNKGKSSVYNLAAELTGDLITNEKIQNLGNVESGNSGSIDFYVSAMEAGVSKGEIVITYEDDNLETKEVRLPYTIEAQEMQMDPNMNPEMDPNMNPEGENPEEKQPMTKQTKMIIGVSGGAIVLLIFIAYYMKKKKAKKLKMLEELEEIETITEVEDVNQEEEN